MLLRRLLRISAAAMLRLLLECSSCTRCSCRGLCWGGWPAAVRCRLLYAWQEGRHSCRVLQLRNDCSRVSS